MSDRVTPPPLSFTDLFLEWWEVREQFMRGDGGYDSRDREFLARKALDDFVAALGRREPDPPPLMLRRFGGTT